MRPSIFRLDGPSRQQLKRPKLKGSRFNIDWKLAYFYIGSKVPAVKSDPENFLALRYLDA
jgi:hypothetical protein